MNPVWRIVLVVAYGILCLAATGRATYQVITKFGEAPLAYSISVASAVLYGVVGYALLRHRRRLALVGTSVELAGVLVVGTLGIVAPSLWPDETIWTGFGSGYGWFPLVLPALALFLLLRERPATAARAT